MTDHMLIMHFDPENGWSAPEIKPYGPLLIDPASSCLQYCPNVFEGMKVRAVHRHVDPWPCWLSQSAVRTPNSRTREWPRSYVFLSAIEDIYKFLAPIASSR